MKNTTLFVVLGFTAGNAQAQTPAKRQAAK